MSLPPAPQYGSPPPVPSSGKQRLRGRVPRLLGWIFLVAGIVLVVAGAALAGTKALDSVNSFQRVPISAGTSQITVNRIGKWVGYYEASDVSSSTNRIPNLRLQITSPSGKDVPFQGYGNRSDGNVTKFTYDFSGHKGIAAIQFRATEKGTYKLQSQEVDKLPSDAVLAFGEDVVNATTITGGVLLAIGVLLVIAAVVLLIVGFVKRGRHKKELAAAPYGYGYAPPPPPYGQTGYGQPGYGQPGAQPGYAQPGYAQPQGQPQAYPPPAGPQGGNTPPDLTKRSES